MNAIYQAMTDRMLPSLPPMEGRIFFFDLADPEKGPKRASRSLRLSPSSRISATLRLV